MKPEQERVRSLLIDTVSLLCKSGLQYNQELKVEGLLGVTLDNHDVFLVHLNEVYRSEDSGSSEGTPDGVEALARGRKRKTHSATASPPPPPSKTKTEPPQAEDTVVIKSENEVIDLDNDSGDQEHYSGSAVRTQDLSAELRHYQETLDIQGAVPTIPNIPQVNMATNSPLGSFGARALPSEPRVILSEEQLLTPWLLGSKSRRPSVGIKKPVLCPHSGCNKSFYRVSECNRHQRVNHSEQLPPIEQPDQQDGSEHPSSLNKTNLTPAGQLDTGTSPGWPAQDIALQELSGSEGSALSQEGSRLSQDGSKLSQGGSTHFPNDPKWPSQEGSKSIHAGLLPLLQDNSARNIFVLPQEHLTSQHIDSQFVSANDDKGPS